MIKLVQTMKHNLTRREDLEAEYSAFRVYEVTRIASLQSIGTVALATEDSEDWHIGNPNESEPVGDMVTTVKWLDAHFQKSHTNN